MTQSRLCSAVFYIFVLCGSLVLLHMIPGESVAADKDGVLRSLSLVDYTRSRTLDARYVEKDGVFYDGTVNVSAPWLVHTNTRDSDRTRVQSFTYDVDTGYAGYYVKLKSNRIYSRYNAFSFWIKGSFDKIRVELKDQRTHTYLVQHIDNQWNRVIIPFDSFSGGVIEAHQLKEIVIVVASDITRPKHGKFFVDDINFIYREERPVKFSVASVKAFLNQVPLVQEMCFMNRDIVFDLSVESKDICDRLSLRLEARSENTPWFYLDASPLDENRNTTVHWNAQYYPSGKYELRFNVMCNNKEKYVSEPYTVYLENLFDYDHFLKKILHDTFLYFENEYQPGTFLTKDRSGDYKIISTGACGFALTVYPLAAERGFISDESAKERILSILSTYLTTLKNVEGLYQHWFDFDYKPVYEDEAVDVVETSYLTAGALFCYQYYSGDDDLSVKIRAAATKLINRVDWTFMLGKEGYKSDGPLHWHYFPKEKRYSFPVAGFNECLITYIMALASPQWISTENFKNWYRDYSYRKFHGEKVVLFPTLFTQHYSFMWIDPRALEDSWVHYFKNAQLATLANREYCLNIVRSPVWGLTACDGPEGYRAYGVNIPFEQSDYDGTISPSASIGSLPYTPAPVLANVRYMIEQYHSMVYGKYGFYDSFNLDKDWSSQSYLGITQGVIYLQIENYLNQSVWKYFMRDKSIRKALKKVHFAFEK